MSDISKASHLPELAKAELEERKLTDDVRRGCEERLEAARRDSRAMLDDVPRILRERRREVVESATAEADCDVDRITVAAEKELACLRELVDEMTDGLVAAVMERVLPDSPECQRHLKEPS